MDVLRSEKFDDVYFSAEDGLAETRYTFLDGNRLPERLTGRDRFTIAETGFGTGLNFLAAWRLFEESAEAHAGLDYISFERFPLHKDKIRDALGRWRVELGGYLDHMLSLYPLRIAGFHRVVLSPRVRLTLVFDDVNDTLPQLVVPGGVDCWFLDGFAPAKNPAMWSETVFQEMKRLSAPGATAATFTAAGAVRRGLESAGFKVEKRRGFGRKRDMTVARFESGQRQGGRSEKPKSVAVIGAGLAGTSCAYALRQYGIEAVLFEKDSIAAGASGNVRGLYNPRFSALRSPESSFYAPAFAQALGTLETLSAGYDLGYRRCGTLHLANSGEKEKRFQAVKKNWLWHEDHLRFLSADEASEKAAVPIDKQALYLPDSGMVCPRALCHAYADNTCVEYGAPPELSALLKKFDSVILACGAAVKHYRPLSWLPVHTVRGQASMMAQTEMSSSLKCNICYGGYISAPLDGVHMLGSTFQKWRDDVDISAEDDRDNLSRLAENMPAMETGMITGSRAALRSSSKDRFPVIGPVPDYRSYRDGGKQNLPGLYVSTAHGSHGIVSTIAGAHMIADQILALPQSLPQETAASLAPRRFLDRARKRGAL